jgi:PR domain zinc finger protein 5
MIKKKIALLSNTCTLLECSNVILFKSKMRAGFPCFYCRELFQNFDTLRLHQEVHSKSNLRRVLKKYTAESLVVYADVTDLRCILCDTQVKDLKELKIHLAGTHNKMFYSKYSDRVVPFKLKDSYFECQICWFNFETFGAIERHMNTHFRNYVCKDCGAGFVTTLRLKAHVQAIHKVGIFPCQYCDRTFTTLTRHRSHIDFVHKMLKKLKCQQCSERFSDYFVQRKHMVEVHGERPIVYRCNVCFKAFNRRYTLSCHIKRHISLKDVHCDVCSYSCYTKTELKEHMLKHNKSNGKLMCVVCNKSYTRRKTLKEHMKIHNDVRRFACDICSQRFVQANSLRTHMKNYHL